MREFTPEQIEAGNKNLDKLVGILQEAQERKTFYNQFLFFLEYPEGECGTPACALGYWAAATQPPARQYAYVMGDEGPAMDFAILREEEDELFGGLGCNSADTPGEAADYIENFVRARRGLR